MYTPLSEDQEAKRLAALNTYQLLDSLPEQDYEDIIHLAAQICQTPVALISLIDKDRQWFKANQGFAFAQTPRDQSFCAYNLNGPTRPLIIEDARLDERFTSNPLVTGDPHIVFYAGVPLVDPDGYTLGSLCVIDQQRRQLSEDQMSALTRLARQVMTLLKLRRANQQLMESQERSRLETQKRARTQDALFQSEAHLELLRDVVPAMIFYLDEQERYQSYNQTFCHWFGVDKTEVLGKTVREFIGESAYQQVAPHLALAYTGQQVQYELDAPQKMGEPRWLSIIYTPYKNETGQVVGVVVLATDITKAKHSEQALQANEAKFRSLIEEAPIATSLYVGRELIIEVANETMLRYWGKDQQVVGRPLVVALPELAGQPFLDILDEIFTTGRTYQTHAARADLVVDGVLSTFYFDYTYKPLFNAAGQVYAILNMAIDVTTQVIAQQQILQTQQLLQQAVDLAQLGVWTIDVATQTAVFSAQVSDWVGGAKPVTLQQSIDAIDPADLASFAAAYQQVQQPGSDGRLNVEYRLINTQTGQVYLLHSMGQTHFDAQGRAVRIEGFSRDITQERASQLALEYQVQERTQELVQANQDLRRSNDNLQQFAYVASHDLQEPLRKIQAFSDLLGSQLADHADPSVGYHLQRIASAAARMSRLIRDLLAYSRISTRQQAFGLVSLDAIMADVLAILDGTIRQTGAQIEVAPLPTARGSMAQLAQLFENLLTNAMKFVQPEQSPRIQVQYVYRAANELPDAVRPTTLVPFYHQISVVDNGIGFEPKYLDRIFQVFQRLNNHGDYTGSGVGLSICQRVVENHGGCIIADSRPGQGSTFCVYLPA